MVATFCTLFSFIFLGMRLLSEVEIRSWIIISFYDSGWRHLREVFKLLIAVAISFIFVDIFSFICTSRVSRFLVTANVYGIMMAQLLLEICLLILWIIAQILRQVA